MLDDWGCVSSQRTSAWLRCRTFTPLQQLGRCVPTSGGFCRQDEAKKRIVGHRGGGGLSAERWFSRPLRHKQLSWMTQQKCHAAPERSRVTVPDALSSQCPHYKRTMVDVLLAALLTVQKWYSIVHLSLFWSQDSPGPKKTDHRRENCNVQIDRGPAGCTAVTGSPSLSDVLKIGTRINLPTVPDPQQAEHCYRTRDCMYGGQMRRIGTPTKGQILASGVGAGRSCHAPKRMQLSYLGFQFPFEVNTQQSRWRYERLN